MTTPPSRVLFSQKLNVIIISHGRTPEDLHHWVSSFTDRVAKLNRYVRRELWSPSWPLAEGGEYTDLSLLHLVSELDSPEVQDYLYVKDDWLEEELKYVRRGFDLSLYDFNRILLHGIITPFSEWTERFSKAYRLILRFLEKELVSVRLDRTAYTYGSCSRCSIGYL